MGDGDLGGWVSLFYRIIGDAIQKSWSDSLIESCLYYFRGGRGRVLGLLLRGSGSMNSSRISETSLGFR